MNQLAKEIAKTLIIIFIMGFCLQVGWNAFFWKFVGVNAPMTYGAGVGFWIFIYSFGFTLTFMRNVLGMDKPKVHLHNHHYFHRSFEAEELDFKEEFDKVIRESEEED